MSNKTYNFNEFDGNDEDLDLLNTEIKINPSFYIHFNLIKSQDALLKDDYKQGFMQYFACAKHLLILCRAGKMIPDDFDERYTKEKEKISQKKDLELIQRLFQEALWLNDVLVGEVFGSRKITTPLKIKRGLKSQSIDEANEKYKNDKDNN